MKTTILATVFAVLLAVSSSTAQAQQTVISPFHNGMGFSNNSDGSMSTYVFRKGELYQNDYRAPPPMPQPQGVEPLLPDNN
jgi:hypothetical protein